MYPVPRLLPKLPPVSVRRSPVLIRVGEMLVRYGLVVCKRMALLVPSDVRTIRLPGGVLRGMRNSILLFDQEANEVEETTTEPIRTVLLPREEPKLPPLIVTTVCVLPVCGEMLLTQGEVIVSRAEALPFAVTTCTLPVRAPAGTLTRIWVSLQLTYWEELGSLPPWKITRLVPRFAPKAVPRIVTT